MNRRAIEPWSWVPVIVLGIALGAGTRYGQQDLPDNLLQFAHCYSVWLAVAFVVGLFLRSTWQALVAGALTELVAVGAYSGTNRMVHGLGHALENGTGTGTDLIVWAIAGVVAGAVLAVAGSMWRNGSDRRRMLATALLAATFVSEGITIITKLEYLIGYAFVGFGAAIAILLPGSWRNVFRAVILAALFSVAIWTAYRYGYGPFHDAIDRIS